MEYTVDENIANHAKAVRRVQQAFRAIGSVALEESIQDVRVLVIRRGYFYGTVICARYRSTSTYHPATHEEEQSLNAHDFSLLQQWDSGHKTPTILAIYEHIQADHPDSPIIRYQFMHRLYKYRVNLGANRTFIPISQFETNLETLLFTELDRLISDA